MQNLDITAIANLADLTLNLVSSAPGNTQEQFELDVDNWVKTTSTTIDGLGVTNKMKILIEQFSLDQQSAAIVLYVLLPAVDSRYYNYFSLLKESQGENIPNMDLLETLVTASYVSKNKLNALLEDHSPLFFWRILMAEDTSGFLATKVMPSKNLVLYFGEDGILSKDLSGLVVLMESPELSLPFDKVETIPEGRIITIHGGFPARQSSFAYALGQSFDQPIYYIQDQLLESSDDPLNNLREALLFVALNNGLLYWQDGAKLLNSNPEYAALVNVWLELKYTRLIIGQTLFEELPQSMLSNSVTTVPLVEQTRPMDQIVWHVAGEKYLGVTGVDYSSLNNRYYPYYERIREALLQVAQSQPTGTLPDTKDVEESYISTSPVELDNIAYLERTDFTFNDMILVTKVANGIASIKKAYLNRIFLDPTEPTGVMAIFEGAVGTGKTMAAECLANELGLPRYRIDYATLTDQIGNIESTLNDMFEQAENNSGCLLFDEADALFAKKSKDPSDPHNLMIAYLIQRIEQYDGLIILTTNKKVRIDPAVFLRSMITVTFPPFKPQQCYDLFVKIMNDMGVTVDSKVKLKELMSVLGANGRQIKNIINNAVLSASEGNVPLSDIVIAAKDLSKAIKIELNK